MSEQQLRKVKEFGVNLTIKIECQRLPLMRCVYVV